MKRELIAHPISYMTGPAIDISRKLCTTQSQHRANVSDTKSSVSSRNASGAKTRPSSTVNESLKYVLSLLEHNVNKPSYNTATHRLQRDPARVVSHSD